MTWDIFDLGPDWEHKEILYRLWDKKIECLFVDIWFDNNVAYIIGCYERPDEIAKALNIHEDCIYGGTEKGIIILNLFQEKYIRGML